MFKNPVMGTIHGLGYGGVLGPLVWRITSPYHAVGDTAWHTSPHAGIDIANKRCGDPVLAALDGKIILDGKPSWAGGATVVRIDHGNGYRTEYFHMVSEGVSVGQTVRTGAVIARVGSSGHSTGCHLHFGVRKRAANGAWYTVNPWPMLDQNIVVKPPVVTPKPPLSTYQVQSGDTLERIGLRFGTTASAIVAANRAKYPTISISFIRTGWILNIP